ncbi:MAG: Hpt domain-containing protein [Rhodobacteraceae bacterium]|jgi:HPt (histidine-containing phosphotransfer) domain-containing protein|nr:Hpt domain-containing protein [Paracoccaceae bacterium]
MIRWDRYNELRAEVGDEDLAEIVDLFLAELEASVTQIMAVPQSGLTADTFHALKGSCLNIGFDTLADLCAAAEQAVARGEGEGIDRARLAEVYAASRAAFEGGLRNAA